jgi:hypothetical protein
MGNDGNTGGRLYVGIEHSCLPHHRHPRNSTTVIPAYSTIVIPAYSTNVIPAYSTNVSPKCFSQGSSTTHRAKHD